MRSNSKRDRIDLSELATTAEDRAMLEAVRRLDRLDARQYLEFLESFTDRHPPTREIPSRHEPFSL